MMLRMSDGGMKALLKMKPYAALILLNFANAGMYVLSAATLKDGMSQDVLIVYRNVFAVIVTVPLALILERRRPKMTALIFLKIVGLVVLDPLFQQHLYYIGMKQTSASFATSLENVIPAYVFILAHALRMEKLNVKQRSGQAKIIGTIIMVAGAIVMILYKGPFLGFARSSSGGEHYGNKWSNEWLKGTFMIIGATICWAFFLILQSNTLKSYPAELSLTALISSMGVVTGAAVALVGGGRSVRPWLIGVNMKLFTTIYSGVICTGVYYCVLGMVLKEKGPIFVSTFDPLTMIITAFLGTITLHEEISLGMVIGAVIIVVGLYCLLWGKSMDQNLSASKSERNEDEEAQSTVTLNRKIICSIDIPATITAHYPQEQNISTSDLCDHNISHIIP